MWRIFISHRIGPSKIAKKPIKPETLGIDSENTVADPIERRKSFVGVITNGKEEFKVKNSWLIVGRAYDYQSGALTDKEEWQRLHAL